MFLAFFHLLTTFTFLGFNPRHRFAPNNVRFIRLNAKIHQFLSSLSFEFCSLHLPSLRLFEIVEVSNSNGLGLIDVEVVELVIEQSVSSEPSLQSG